VTGAALAAVFLILRLALLTARQPFFDEQFTIWIASKPFAGIVEALRHDSGPPLYYFVVHALSFKTVLAARLLSLACASASMACIAVTPSGSEGPGRAGGAKTAVFGAARGTRPLALARGDIAAMLLAVFPPAVLFAVDARSYAMCAMFVTIGVLSLDRDRYGVAAGAFVLAAYSHYYGFLFFPLLLRRWKSLAIALIAFAPGLWLALHQPAEATEWIGRVPSWPDALFPQPPIALLIAGAIAVVIATIHWNRFTTMTVVPIAAALLFAIAGRNVYFPMRFESVIAPPLVLAIATSLESWKPVVRRGLMTALITVSVIVCVLGTLDHMRRPIDSYREAAQFARALPKDAPLVATGYLYLETVLVRPDAIAFPREQAQHPGWRARPVAGSAPPPAPFYWIGERAAPELSILRRAYRVEPVYVNARAVVARVR
jgi:hypothetical protein